MLDGLLHDPIALVWVVSSVILAAVSGAGVVSAFGDMRAMDGILNGRRTFAFDQLRWQAALLAIGLGWMYVGIGPLLDERVTPLSGGVAVLVAANVLLAVVSFLSYRRRRQLRVGR